MCAQASATAGTYSRRAFSSSSSRSVVPGLCRRHRHRPSRGGLSHAIPGFQVDPALVRGYRFLEHTLLPVGPSRRPPSSGCSRRRLQSGSRPACAAFDPSGRQLNRRASYSAECENNSRMDWAPAPQARQFLAAVLNSCILLIRPRRVARRGWSGAGRALMPRQTNPREPAISRSRHSARMDWGHRPGFAAPVVRLRPA